MDKDGYPDKHELKKITEWDYKDFQGLMDYVFDLWKYSNCGYWKRGRIYYHISTGGWSGNEDIIRALMNNAMFWACCWWSSKRGGHYMFEIRKQSKEANGKDGTR